MARAPIDDPGDENLRVGKPESVAGGVTAARTSLRQVRAETGVLARAAGQAHHARLQGAGRRPLPARRVGRRVPRITAAEVKRSGDPHRAVFYTSGRTSNEAAFLYQLLVRMLGTN
jgi:hypothetical protein